MAAGEANLSKKLGVPGVSKRNVSYRRYGCNQIQIIRSSVTVSDRRAGSRWAVTHAQTAQPELEGWEEDGKEF